MLWRCDEPGVWRLPGKRKTRRPIGRGGTKSGAMRWSTRSPLAVFDKSANLFTFCWNPVRTGMEKVLIDKFIVPEESKASFLEAARKSSTFVRTLPGFVEGFVYEKVDGDGRHNVITTAVWASEEAFANAKQAAA